MKSYLSRHKAQAGFSLAEVLVAMLVMMVALLPLLMTIMMSYQMTQRSTGTANAASIARQEIEIMKAGDFPISLPVTSTVQRGVYTAERNLTDISATHPYCVQLEVKVYLTDQDPDKPLAHMVTIWAEGGP